MTWASARQVSCQANVSFVLKKAPRVKNTVTASAGVVNQVALLLLLLALTLACASLRLLMSELTSCILPAGTGLIKDKSKRQEGGNCGENVTQPVGLAAPDAAIAAGKPREKKSPKGVAASVYRLKTRGPLSIHRQWPRLWPAWTSFSQ